MAAATPTDVVRALYRESLERGIRYFFPGCPLDATGPSEVSGPVLTFQTRPDGGLEFDWFGQHYELSSPGRSFTENQIRLLAAIGGVLSARYRTIFHAHSAATSLQLFRGLPEDRYVSAFLDPFTYLDDDAPPNEQDIIADAIEVLRESSLLTYENRRISTGVLLLGSNIAPPVPDGAIAYNSALTSIKSFHRLCDGLQTVFVVNGDGLMVELADIRQWPVSHATDWLPAPSSSQYRAHSLATLRDGHICLVLTPNGELKVFAEGAQLFHFVAGRWRLSDVSEKYHAWRNAIGDARLAERLFTASLDLAESRQGGLFVVLDDPRSVRQFVAAGDLLGESGNGRAAPSDAAAKDQIHYLLRNRRITELSPSLIETIARMDGALVLDRDSNLLAFGAILRPDLAWYGEAREGGRTTAAASASHSGSVLKISEDGLVSFFRNQRCIWEI